ncbi:MAG: SDR family oxidoreductase [Ignavibacteriaceae bacterium]
MKFLITGGSGLLGQYLNIELSNDDYILTLYNEHEGNCKEFNSLKVDIKDFDKVREVIREFNPDIVIHTAAISTPQLSDNLSAKEVYKTNVNATKIVAEECERNGSKLIYLSTDLVYAGYRGSMLTENSKLIPVSLYAETILMGETKIQETYDNHIILRTALLYGFGLNKSKCHFHEMYKNLKENKNVKLFTDQFRTPLSLFDASRIISSLMKLEIKGEVINFGGIERVSRYELGEILCSVTNLDRAHLEKITMDDIPGLPKVEDVSMNTERLQSFGIKQKGIEESINEILNTEY